MPIGRWICSVDSDPDRPWGSSSVSGSEDQKKTGREDKLIAPNQHTHVENPIGGFFFLQLFEVGE